MFTFGRISTIRPVSINSSPMSYRSKFYTNGNTIHGQKKESILKYTITDEETKMLRDKYNYNDDTIKEIVSKVSSNYQMNDSDKGYGLISLSSLESIAAEFSRSSRMSNINNGCGINESLVTKFPRGSQMNNIDNGCGIH